MSPHIYPLIAMVTTPPERDVVCSLTTIPPLTEKDWEAATSLARDDIPDPPPPMPLLFLPVSFSKTTYYALLDSGASDSFISMDVAQKAALRLLPLRSPRRVRVPNGQMITVSHFVRVTVTIGSLRARLFLRVIPTPSQLFWAIRFCISLTPSLTGKNGPCPSRWVPARMQFR